MKTVSLKDVCQISMGQAPDGSSYNDIGEGFPLIAGAGDFGALSPKPKKFTREPTRVSEVDDIILCIRATIGDLNWSDKAYCLGRGVAGLRPRADKLDRHYLWHWLASQKDYLFSQGTGSTFKQISRSTIDDLSFPLPPLPEQKRIAAILDKADSIRRKRQVAVRLTEELLRSVFLDMFGDPVTNPKGWETRAFVEVCETRLGKMLDAKQQTGEHLRPYLRNSNVQWDRIETSDLEQMDFDGKDQKTFSLLNGDVLICEGGEVGRAAIWRYQLMECYFQKAIHRARPKQNLAIPEFVMFWLWFMSKNGGFKDHVTSATIAHLTGEKLKEIQMTLPPITVQHQFLKVYNALTELKISTNQHQTQMDTLFNTLIQYAFKGGCRNERFQADCTNISARGNHVRS